jgi:hypothetical protein
VITANQAHDHATIARFRVRHEEALAGLFGQVLGLCAEAGLVRAGVVAVDGSKFAAAASDSAIRTYEEIAAEVLAEAGRIDAAEDEIHGEARGDELPEHPAHSRRQAGLAAGRRRSALERERAAARQPIPRDREGASSSATAAWPRTGGQSTREIAAYEAYRARGVMRYGRRFGGPPDPYEPPPQPEGKINTTDPDARRMKFVGRNFIPAYNAQAAVTEEQIIIAAEITTEGGDFEQLDPVITAAERELAEQAAAAEAAAIAELEQVAPEPVVCDGAVADDAQFAACLQQSAEPIPAGFPAAAPGAPPGPPYPTGD